MEDEPKDEIGGLEENCVRGHMKRSSLEGEDAKVHLGHFKFKIPME